VEVEPERPHVPHGIGRIERVFPERLVVPDVLADRHADPRAAKAQDERAIPRLRVAPFIEDVVGRKQALVVHGCDPAGAGRDRGVEDPAAQARRVLLERAEEPQRAAGRPGDPRRGTLRLGDERPPLDEVPRRVAADGELRKEHEVGALALRRRPSSRIFFEFPAKSPTVVSICATAIFMVESRESGAVSRNGAVC
jgi:hypothetical protein